MDSRNVPKGRLESRILSVDMKHERDWLLFQPLSCDSLYPQMNLSTEESPIMQISTDLLTLASVTCCPENPCVLSPLVQAYEYEYGRQDYISFFALEGPYHSYEYS